MCHSCGALSRSEPVNEAPVHYDLDRQAQVILLSGALSTVSLLGGCRSVLIPRDDLFLVRLQLSLQCVEVSLHVLSNRGPGLQEAQLVMAQCVAHLVHVQHFATFGCHDTKPTSWVSLPVGLDKLDHLTVPACHFTDHGRNAVGVDEGHVGLWDDVYHRVGHSWVVSDLGDVSHDQGDDVTIACVCVCVIVHSTVCDVQGGMEYKEKGCVHADDSASTPTTCKCVLTLDQLQEIALRPGGAGKVESAMAVITSVPGYKRISLGGIPPEPGSLELAQSLEPFWELLPELDDELFTTVWVQFLLLQPPSVYVCIHDRRTGAVCQSTLSHVMWMRRQILILTQNSMWNRDVHAILCTEVLQTVMGLTCTVDESRCMVTAEDLKEDCYLNILYASILSLLIHVQ